MPLTKKALISKISDGTELTQEQSAATVEKIIEVIKSTLESGDEVMISGFGKFSVKEKKERNGRNPATGDNMVLDARKVVSFKISEKLKEQMNGDKG
jgi:integration host factor subunit alpha